MSRARVQRLELETGSWELAFAAPCPALQPYMDTYGGYIERDSTVLRRFEMPFPRAPLILGFDPIKVSVTGRAEDLVDGYTGFLSGLTDSPALVDSGGSQSGVQVNLTPLGAYQLFGVPMTELTNRVAGLDELLGSAGREIIERLRDAPSWDARFDLLDRLFLKALSVNRPPTRAVAWAWQQISREPSAVSIGRLADAAGWSHKHFISRFRDEVGVAPKTAARIVRFHRAVEAITPGRKPRWSDIAAAAGYYDQAHLTREFRALAGCTPTEVWRRRLLDGGLDGGEMDSPGR